MPEQNEVIHTPEDKKAESTVDTAALTKLKSQLRAKAEREVLQNHQDEYHQVASRLFAEHGLEFTRRLTEKEKAERELKALLEKHPELAQSVTGVAAVPAADEWATTSQTIQEAAPNEDGPAVLEDRSNLPF